VTAFRLYVCAVFLLLPALPLAAAPKKKNGAPPLAAKAAEPAASTRLRVWKGEFPSQRTIQLTLRPSDKAATPTELGGYEPASRFGDYLSVPAGASTVEVRASGEAGAALATFATHLLPNGSATLIVREDAAGAYHFELLDDAPTGDATSAELLVRNFVPALQSLQLDAGPDLHLRLGTPGSFLHLRGLPRAPLHLETSGQDSAGHQIHWSNEVDFRKIRRATLLIVTDSYGRIRPRVVIDASSLPIVATPAVPTRDGR
jgi:hypothetical protein